MAVGANALRTSTTAAQTQEKMNDRMVGMRTKRPPWQRRKQRHGFSGEAMPKFRWQLPSFLKPSAAA
jgi:hypothetical protein